MNREKLYDRSDQEYGIDFCALLSYRVFSEM